MPTCLRKRLQLLVGLACVAIAVAGCGDGVNQAVHSDASVTPRLVGSSAAGVRASNFVLRDQRGRKVSLTAERGRFVVLTFLYTHCQDVCPLIATQLNQALAHLGRARSHVRVLAISVDPKGDTPRPVRRFIHVHHLLSQFRYLTGTRTQLAPIWRAYHVAATPLPDGQIDHSAYELLLDRNGKPQVIYTSTVKAGQIVHDLHALGLT